MVWKAEEVINQNPNHLWNHQIESQQQKIYQTVVTNIYWQGKLYKHQKSGA
jgi:hypothetical protein